MPTIYEHPSGRGGPFDVIYEFGDTPERMGFIIQGPGSRARANYFAATIRSSGEDAPAFEAQTYQPINLKSFHQGGDKERLESADLRYRWSDGQVATHIEREVRLASAWTTAETGYTATCVQAIDFTDNDVTFSYFCMGVDASGTAHLRVYDDGVPEWDYQDPAGGFGADIKHLFANDTYLFAAMGTGNNSERWDGTKDGGWTTLATAADCYGWYGNKLMRALGNVLYTADANNNGDSWSATTKKVGWDSTSINDIYPAGGYLIVCKPEGAWLWDGTTLHPFIDAQIKRFNANFVGGTEFEGEVFLPKVNTLHRAKIAGTKQYTVSDVTPKIRGLKDLNKSDYNHGFPKRCFGSPGTEVYVALDDGEGVFPELLMYNGIHFHQVYRGTSGDTMHCAGYSRINGWLVINDGAGTHYKQLRALSNAEYPNYNTSGQFTTPVIDGGLPNMPKSIKSVSVKTQDCDSSNYITIEYSFDEGTTWTQFATIDSSSPQRQEYPIGSIDLQVTGLDLMLRFTLYRDAADATKTPVLLGDVVVYALPIPPAQHLYEDTLVLNPDQPLRNGDGKVSDAYSMTDMTAFLAEMEDTTETIIRTDRLGRRSRVKNTNLSEVEMAIDPVNLSREVLTISASFLEVFTGPAIQVEGALSLSSSTSFSGEDDQTYGGGRWGLGYYVAA
jgi:hypothetical protein